MDGLKDYRIDKWTSSTSHRILSANIKQQGNQWTYYFSLIFVWPTILCNCKVPANLLPADLTLSFAECHGKPGYESRCRHITAIEMTRGIVMKNAHHEKCETDHNVAAASILGIFSWDDLLHSLGVFTQNREIFKNDSFSSRIAVERKPKVSPG